MYGCRSPRLMMRTTLNHSSALFIEARSPSKTQTLLMWLVLWRFIYLNTWPPVGGALGEVMEPSRDKAWPEEVCHWCEFWGCIASLYFPVALSASVWMNCNQPSWVGPYQEAFSSVTPSTIWEYASHTFGGGLSNDVFLWPLSGSCHWMTFWFQCQMHRPQTF